jgi:hypothetical protein
MVSRAEIPYLVTEIHHLWIVPGVFTMPELAPQKVPELVPHQVPELLSQQVTQQAQELMQELMQGDIFPGWELVKAGS